MLITNKLGLPDPYFEACKSDYTYKDKRYSVTTLSASSPRVAILQRRHADEIVQDCAEMAWLVFGQAVHYFLEQHGAKFEEVKEIPLEYHTKNGYTLSGRADLYNALEEKVSDWKTASAWKITHRDFTDYRKQLLLYAFMLRKMGYPCRRGELVFLIKDHSKKDLRADLNGTYPNYPVYTAEFEFTDEEFNACEQEVENYFLEIEKFEALSDADLPLCNKEFRSFNGADKWAVMKKNRKRALRVYDSEAEAKANIEALGGDFIEYRECEEKRCKEYCNASPFCYNYINNYANFQVVSNENQIKAGFATRQEAQEFINIFNLENSHYIKEIKKLTNLEEE